MGGGRSGGAGDGFTGCVMVTITTPNLCWIAGHVWPYVFEGIVGRHRRKEHIFLLGVEARLKAFYKECLEVLKNLFRILPIGGSCQYIRVGNEGLAIG